MKIAITCKEDNLDSIVDERFGRANFFLIVEVKDNKIIKKEFVKNSGSISEHGAGVKSAQQLVDKKIDFVVSGRLGPNAKSIFDKVNVKSYEYEGKIKDLLSKLESGSSFLNSESDDNNENNSKIESSDKIFFPILDNNSYDSRISPHFGHAPFFGIYDLKNKELKIIENTLNHSNPNKSPIDEIVELVNPTTIFAKGIGRKAINIINQKGLKLKTGNFDTIREVLDNFDNLCEDVSDCGHDH
jgi:predicted Fe-Mo cluster-binding NifX family protein